MPNILLTIKTKLVVTFILVSIFILTLIYLTFSSLFQEHMLKSEEEKAILIAQTIEPMIGINHYLGLHDDIKQLAKQTIENDNIESLRITIEGKEIFFLPYDEQQRYIDIKYPIKDTTTQLQIGTIDIFYKLENFDKTFYAIQTKIIKYMAFLAITFLLFTLLTRKLLNPLNQIADKVQNYKLDSTLDFSNIKKEVETDAIIEAFKKMVANVHEHTLLLERYKYALDASAIVSKSNVDGTITYVNDEFCRASGYSRYEILGNTYRILRHPQTKDEVIKDIWSRLNKKQIWKGTIKNLTKDGQTFHIKITIVPIFDENGDTVEFISLSHDITQIIKQKEQILRQTTNRLTNIPNRIKLEEDMKIFQATKLALVSID
ncbi:MAG: PAS domain-containing protein, partial [Sulfurimonas sp.]|nr:PAS domain-containing protein [Sulfurimonas sp.]